MDGWMDRGIDRWMDRWMDGAIVTWRDEYRQMDTEKTASYIDRHRDR